MRRSTDSRFDAVDEYTSQNITLEDSAGVCDLDRLAQRKQALVHALHIFSQLSSTFGQDDASHVVALALRFVEHGSVGSDNRPLLTSVESAQDLICALRICCFQESFVEARRLAPAFLKSQGRTQSLARQVEGAAFIAERIAPAASPRCLPFTVPAVGHRTRAGNHDDSGRPFRCTFERNLCVVSY